MEKCSSRFGSATASLSMQLSIELIVDILLFYLVYRNSYVNLGSTIRDTSAVPPWWVCFRLFVSGNVYLCVCLTTKRKKERECAWENQWVYCHDVNCYHCCNCVCICLHVHTPMSISSMSISRVPTFYIFKNIHQVHTKIHTRTHGLARTHISLLFIFFPRHSLQLSWALPALHRVSS